MLFNEPKRRKKIVPFCYFTRKAGVDSPLMIITRKSLISYEPDRQIKIRVVVLDSGHMEVQYTTRDQIEEQSNNLQLMEKQEIIKFRDQVRRNLKAVALKKAGEISTTMGLRGV